MSAQKPRFVRQFALTQGRVRSIGADLPLDTLVQATSSGRAQGSVLGEEALILEMCRTPISVAEIGAHLHVHLGIARVLVSDLAAQGFVAVSDTGNESGPDVSTLERLLDDLQTL
jgi:hypothetical protein